MSIEELMQSVFTAEELAEIVKAENTILNIIRPKLTQLSPEDRKTILKMGFRMTGFVEKTLSYGARNPKFVPAYINLEEAQNSFDLVKVLLGHYETLYSTTEMLNDTIMQAGSKAYQAALAIYDLIKAAAKNRQPGAQIIADELGVWFHKGSSEPPQNGHANN